MNGIIHQPVRVVAGAHPGPERREAPAVVTMTAASPGAADGGRGENPPRRWLIAPTIRSSRSARASWPSSSPPISGWRPTEAIAAAGPSMLEHAGTDLIGARFFDRFRVERPGAPPASPRCAGRAADDRDARSARPPADARRQHRAAGRGMAAARPHPRPRRRRSRDAAPVLRLLADRRHPRHAARRRAPRRPPRRGAGPRRGAAGAEARRRARQQRQERVPRRHEPRDPHPDERRARARADPRRHRADPRSARDPGGDGRLRQVADGHPRRRPRPLQDRGGRDRDRGDDRSTCASSATACASCSPRPPGAKGLELDMRDRRAGTVLPRRSGAHSPDPGEPRLERDQVHRRGPGDGAIDAPARGQTARCSR